jgi:large subunit ribosomal protein L25
MDIIKLDADVRENTGKKLRQERNAGKIPGVLYGRELEPKIVSVDNLVFSKVYHKAGHSGLVELTVGDTKPVNVLIQDVQTDYLGRPLHIDFYQVKMDEAIRTEVPLKLVGDAPGAFNLGGSLVQVLEEVEVEALPANLPSHIDIDVAVLEELEASLSVADITVPDKVKILTDEHEMVCKIEPPRSEEEMAELDAEMGEEVTPEGEETEAEAQTTEDTES